MWCMIDIEVYSSFDVILQRELLLGISQGVCDLSFGWSLLFSAIFTFAPLFLLESQNFFFSKLIGPPCIVEFNSRLEMLVLYTVGFCHSVLGC